MQATQAYLVGNKALAKELGAKGRHHSDQMKAAHAAASENIFLQRNMRNASSVVSNKNGVCLLSCAPSICIWMQLAHHDIAVTGALMLCNCHCLDLQSFLAIQLQRFSDVVQAFCCVPLMLHTQQVTASKNHAA